MDETKAADRFASDPPAAAVKRRRGISIVWAVPVVAALIGGFLAYRAYTETGPTVTLDFYQIHNRGRKASPCASDFTSFLQRYVAQWAGGQGLH